MAGNSVAQPDSAWPGAAVVRAAAENRATRPQRSVAALLAATILAPGLGFAFAIGWLVVLAGVEALDCEPARRLAGLPVRQRWLALIYMLASTIAWSVLPVVLLRQGDATLTVVAIIGCCLQMMHAQSFAYRSRAALLVMIAPPAAVLATLALASGLPAQKLMVLVPAMVLAIGYVVVGSLTNAAAADAIDASHREVERLAYTDPTTGLANRRRFAEELGDRIDAAKGCDGDFTLALVDLDGLKAINDALGHAAGDAVLAGIAARLAAAAGDGDLVARLGGDEFAWLSTPGSTAPVDGRPLRCRLEIAGRHLGVTASIGAARFPRDGDTAETLFKAADQALYAAKRELRAA